MPNLEAEVKKLANNLVAQGNPSSSQVFDVFAFVENQKVPLGNVMVVRDDAGTKLSYGDREFIGSTPEDAKRIVADDMRKHPRNYTDKLSPYLR